MELGLFVILTAVGALGYWKNNNMYMIAMSIIAFFIIALILAVDGEVSQVKEIEQRDSGGNLTGTERETDVIFSEETILVSYIYYGFAAFTTMLFMYRAIQMGQTGKY